MAGRGNGVFCLPRCCQSKPKDSEPSRGVHRGLTGPDQLLLVSPREYVERRVHGDPVLDRIVHLPDDGFEGP
jgi:hypothetical protein